jgi:hypothetical protein
MSGLEVAGIVLGAIPLVVSALEHYIDGVQTVRRLFGYRLELKKLVMVLVTEDATFRNTCEKLLDGIASPSTVESLLQDPGGLLWNDPALNRKLKARLQTSHSVYMTRVQDMNEALEVFKQRLALGPDGKVSSSPLHCAYQRHS